MTILFALVRNPSIVCAFRLGPEERMMSEVFGADYVAYMRGTQRLVPGLW